MNAQKEYVTREQMDSLVVDMCFGLGINSKVNDVKNLIDTCDYIWLHDSYEINDGYETVYVLKFDRSPFWGECKSKYKNEILFGCRMEITVENIYGFINKREISVVNHEGRNTYEGLYEYYKGDDHLLDKIIGMSERIEVRAVSCTPRHPYLIADDMIEHYYIFPHDDIKYWGFASYDQEIDDSWMMCLSQTRTSFSGPGKDGKRFRKAEAYDNWTIRDYKMPK